MYSLKSDSIILRDSSFRQPDQHGYVSLGTSVDATLAAVECADTVIAVINKYVPRSFGDA
ncbi:MAG: hypothetical protein IJ973_06845, partial [Christensenellaceae bacterium]|nr:hypothetical protein [Christensenellaceae bacterium]